MENLGKRLETKRDYILKKDNHKFEVIDNK